MERHRVKRAASFVPQGTKHVSCSLRRAFGAINRFYSVLWETSMIRSSAALCLSRGNMLLDGYEAKGAPTKRISLQRERLFALGNTAQYACGIFRKNRALISSLFLAIHKVFLRKSAVIRTRFFSESALAALCGIAFIKCHGGLGVLIQKV